MARSLQQRYLDAYTRFLDAVPMDDVKFRGKLTSLGLFPGDTKEAVIAKSTKAEMVELYLTKCIDTGFSDDGNTNDSLGLLLTALEGCGFPPAQQLAKDVKGMYVATY